MVMERKDLEHDLELIETKNMKIICKNIRHDRAWQRPDRAPNGCSNVHIPGRLARVCACISTAVRDLQLPFAAFAFKTGTTHAKLSTVVPSFQAASLLLFQT